MGVTLDKIPYGKWGVWIMSVGMLLTLLPLMTAQPGFLSIDCGGKTNRTGENNIMWVTDDNYINVGHRGEIGNASAYGSYLHTLRVFPKPLNKSCYQLPVVPGVPYLLRLWFAVGNYSGFKKLPSFAFSIETEGMLAMGNVAVSDKYAFYNETILVSSGRLLYVCLIRTSESDDPFISAIELRTLQQGMYGQAKPGTMLMLVWRYDAGGNITIRYPQDMFDRIWDYELRLTFDNHYPVQPVNCQETISTSNTTELPPSAVMQTAAVIIDTAPGFNVGSTDGHRILLLLYVAEIEQLNMSEHRSFYVTINDEKRSEAITSLSDYSTRELKFISNPTDDFYFALVNTVDATSDPIMNAFETYKIIDTQPATYAEDHKALEAIKIRFDIKEWISDPCFLIQWKGIVCESSTLPIRISGIDLSGKNLTGSVPDDIGQLAALVNLSLDNNHLIGQLPNFSSLIMLERLYLQNNNLSGNLPDWLGKLKNLKELNIENNNFSGIIPAQLLHSSLKFSYCGNPYLPMHKGECILNQGKHIQHHTKNNKLKIVLGLTLIGILMMALALIVGIVLYRNKFRGKEQGFANKRSGLEKKFRSFLSRDDSIVVVPNPTKCHVFTLGEMIAATQNFSREIGRGGFGSVFLGKLPQGKDIAVKVLAQFSQQGVNEFLNEVNLLSRIHHRNLVSLLGYCNESREIMLIYDYMSGGSLRDHLYGPTAHHSKLNWRTRLKIALDAAQGLEYLHVGCNPKIIHRDIKTANILLDSELNGKLGDFGLSKMTTDGEATHVTTAVKGTAGYLDPEYFSTQILTKKSDVYSFGVVLLEIICGRQPIDQKLPLEELNIIRWVTPYVLGSDNPCTIAKIIDKRLGRRYDEISISVVAKLAMRCVQAEPSSRPSVSEIVAELREAINIEDKFSLPFSEENGMESSDLLSAAVSLSVDSSGPGGRMEWSANNSNISHVKAMSPHGHVEGWVE
eukprot:PITA_05299